MRPLETKPCDAAQVIECRVAFFPERTELT